METTIRRREDWLISKNSKQSLPGFRIKKVKSMTKRVFKLFLALPGNNVVLRNLTPSQYISFFAGVLSLDRSKAGSVLSRHDPTRTAAFLLLCLHLKMPTGNRYRMQMEPHYWASAQGERRDTRCRGLMPDLASWNRSVENEDVFPKLWTLKWTLTLQEWASMKCGRWVSLA